MNHLDLFSGIGGFALAAEWCGITTVGFSEIDSYASAVLRERWPSIKNYGDIRHITRDTLAQRVDLITGGFPCQPFSVAGKRKGAADDRFLWPEMLRVIKEFKPAWVLGENVAGFVNMELDRACADLEAEGYEVQPLIIPACAIGAPHRRDRVWIIAHAGCGDSRSPQESKQSSADTAGLHCASAANTEHVGFNGAEESEGVAQRNDFNAPWAQAIEQLSRRAGASTIAHSQGTGLPCSDNRSREEQLWRGYPREHWRNTNWLEAATLLCRVGNGLPNRTHRIKALGNAIVPQVAYEILHAISCLTPDRSGRSSRLKEANES